MSSSSLLRKSTVVLRFCGGWASGRCSSLSSSGDTSAADAAASVKEVCDDDAPVGEAAGRGRACPSCAATAAIASSALEADGEADDARGEDRGAPDELLLLLAIEGTMTGEGRFARAVDDDVVIVRRPLTTAGLVRYCCSYCNKRRRCSFLCLKSRDCSRHTSSS
jgi:hypothetical protein